MPTYLHSCPNRGADKNDISWAAAYFDMCTNAVTAAKNIVSNAGEQQRVAWSVHGK
jgi:hypothetical protein